MASASPTGTVTCGATTTCSRSPNPTAIRGIHRAYLDAGADIVETNTFNAQRISLADYGMEELAYELNLECGPARGVGVRREHRGRRRTSRDSWPARSGQPAAPHRSRPTSMTLARATSPISELVDAYLEQANGLVDGGADLLLVETIFDTLNAKAAIFALETLFEQRGRRWPVMISGTITDASGRTLSGQVTEAFWNSIRHARPLLVGLNCALGGRRDAALPGRDRPDRRLLRVLLPERRVAERVRRVRRGA